MATQPRVTNTQAFTGNIIRDSALGLVPETLDNYMELNGEIWGGGPLSAAEIEMARLRNARKVNCVFCKSVRYDIAVEAGLSEDKVGMIEDQLGCGIYLERRPHRTEDGDFPIFDDAGFFPGHRLAVPALAAGLPEV